VNITFCVKLGKTPTENYEMLRNVYNDEALSRSNIFEWFKRFKDGRENLQGDQEAGVLEPLEMETQSQMSAKW
jgi:hypothetical protein